MDKELFKRISKLLPPIGLMTPIFIRQEDISMYSQIEERKNAFEQRRSEAEEKEMARDLRDRRVRKERMKISKNRSGELYVGDYYEKDILDSYDESKISDEW